MYYKQFNTIKISQPIGDFFVSKIPAKDLVEIADADIRQLSTDLDDYLGIQRKLSQPRAKEIRSYISHVDATFPNAIILATDGKYVSWDDGTNSLVVSCNEHEKKGIMKILDGQHRLAGFCEDNYTYEENGVTKDFELIVVIFIGADIATQANIFATVNLAQTKVNKSLVYDLESYSKSRSPEKTCHDIVVLLNSINEGDDGVVSPFFNRIKRLGVKSSSGNIEVVTQAAIVENIMPLISPEPKADRDIILRQKLSIFGKKNNEYKYMDEDSLNKFIFRKAFVNNKDEVILANILNFFNAVAGIWPKAWDVNNKKSVLYKTVGVKALFRVFKDIYLMGSENHIENYFNIVSVDFYKQVLLSRGIDGDMFENIDATSKSVNEIYNMIMG